MNKNTAASTARLPVSRSLLIHVFIGVDGAITLAPLRCLIIAEAAGIAPPVLVTPPRFQHQGIGGDAR